MNVQSLSLNKFKDIKKLSLKKFRDQSGLFMAEGLKVVSEALLSEFLVQEIIIESSLLKDDNFQKIIKKAQNKNIKIYSSTLKQAEMLSADKTAPGVFAVLKKENFNLNDLDQSESVLILDQLNDPGNIGTIIRTALWFGVKNIVLTKDSADLYNAKTVRASMGAIFSVKVSQDVVIKDLLKFLEKNKYKKYSLTAKGKDIRKIKLPAKAAYILGSESHGVDKELLNNCDDELGIKGSGIDSLNVAISAGILLYAANKDL